jgi:hypothetical protein
MSEVPSIKDISPDSVVLEWNDPDGKVHVEKFLIQAFQGPSTKILAILLNGGAAVRKGKSWDEFVQHVRDRAKACLATTPEIPENSYHSFIWADANTLFVLDGRKDLKSTKVAVCQRTGRVCKVAGKEDRLSPIVMTGTNVFAGKCQDGKWCVDYDCELNQTTWESLCDGIGMKKGKRPENFGQTIDFNRTPEGGLQSFHFLFDQAPQGGWLSSTKKGKQIERICEPGED